MSSLLREWEAEEDLEAELSAQQFGHVESPATGPSLSHMRARPGSVGVLHLAPQADPLLRQAHSAEGHDDIGLEDATEDAYEPPELDIDMSHIPSDWEVRSKRQYEDTCCSRPLSFGLSILRAAPPEVGTFCEVCTDNKACLRCLDCKSSGPLLLCGVCDASRHPYAHFHRRESFDGGFWQREAPSVSFSEDGAQYERGKHCNTLMLVLI